MVQASLQSLIIFTIIITMAKCIGHVPRWRMKLMHANAWDCWAAVPQVDFQGFPQQFDLEYQYLVISRIQMNRIGYTLMFLIAFAFNPVLLSSKTTTSRAALICSGICYNNKTWRLRLTPGYCTVVSINFNNRLQLRNKILIYTFRYLWTRQ